MIPEYNKICFETDDLLIVEAKKQVLENALKNGLITQDEFNTEKTRVLQEYSQYCSKLGYAFNW